MAKNSPKRQCVGCSQMQEKKELMRVIKTPEGEILLDQTGRKNGRGAYVCRRKECLDMAIKKKGLERSLGIAIPMEVVEGLKKEFMESET